MFKTVYKLFYTIFFVTFFSVFSVFSVTVASENTALTPDRFQLGQNHPNPFNPSTQFDYSVPTASKVVIKVYNILGQEVRTLVNGQVPQGVHTIKWEGKNDLGYKVASGVYMYRIEALAVVDGADQAFVETHKMILVR